MYVIRLQGIIKSTVPGRCIKDNIICDKSQRYNIHIQSNTYTPTYRCVYICRYAHALAQTDIYT